MLKLSVIKRTDERILKDMSVHYSQPKGFTCKRQSGKSTDGWSGVRVWDRVNLRPKNVFMLNTKDIK